MSSKGGRGKVGYAKPPEPKFIRDLKAKVGYREPDGIEAKMKSLTDEAEELEERDDEKPTVVVLKEGDLTEEEVRDHQSCERSRTGDEVKEEIPPADGRIMFKKPKKRTGSSEDSEKTLKQKKARKEKKSSSLLSFDEEDE